MDQTSLTKFISSFGEPIFLSLSILFNIYQFHTNRKEKSSSEIAEKVINHFFIPFQNSLGMNLYKKITNQNWEEIRTILITFKEKIDNSKETYYLSDNILLSINLLTPYLKLNSLNKKDFKNLNKYFQKFSKNYLKEHCYFRKILHLPIKGALHRLQFKLYGTHWNYLALVSKLAFIVFIFIIISPLYFTIIFYIANWVEKIAYFILNDLH
ncbi:hypothetical protein EGW35_08695 [Enterococcus durans]|uniref:hypothetical protein n=1 Tax=Enterococcus durans TaxID=53345 RepID=UPI000F4D977E|nr:hypothetical protein [Enterococcus durans]ROX82213.1 hypothetical protein EGW35_08695 [Enterococcus durans]